MVFEAEALARRHCWETLATTHASSRGRKDNIADIVSAGHKTSRLEGQQRNPHRLRTWKLIHLRLFFVYLSKLVATIARRLRPGRREWQPPVEDPCLPTTKRLRTEAIRPLLDESYLKCLSVRGERIRSVLPFCLALTPRPYDF
jgi:hypothetical protein